MASPPNASVRVAAGPVGSALRLAGVLGLVAQVVIVVLQFADFPWDTLGVSTPGPMLEVLPASIRILQLLAVLATLLAAWRGRRGLLRVGAGLVLALSATRLTLNLPPLDPDPRALVSWLAAAVPVWGAAICLLLGFRTAVPDVSAHERAVWVRSAPVGAALLGALILMGQTQDLPNLWTLVYGVTVLVLLGVEVLLSHRGPIAATETAATWYALAVLAVFVLPVQLKDLVLPVEGQSSLVLLGEVTLTVVAALVGWYGGASRAARSEPVSHEIGRSGQARRPTVISAERVDDAPRRHRR